MMEVQYEREAEGVNGVDLQIRRRTSSSQHPKKTNIITSDLKDTSNNFGYSVSMENTNNYTGNNKNGTNIITNGENPKIIEGRSAIEEKLANFDEHNVAQNEDTNGFTAHHSGGHVDEFSLPGSNGGDKETDTESNTSSLSKIPETSAGLRFVLDDSSTGDNIESSEFYNGENMVNKTQVINDQNEIVEAGQSQEVDEPEIDEYDVEKVIQKQETHDLICPNCSACITKRVILKRKRKFSRISKDESKPSPSLHPIVPDTDKGKPEHEIPPRKGADDSIDAVSCFSCFSIFVPKGDGFLCWRFKPQPGQSVDTSAGSMDSEAQIKGDGSHGTGKVFPMWILTCCQPSDTKRPDTAGKPDPKSSPTSEIGEKVPSKLQSPLPPDELPVSNKPDEGPKETQPSPTLESSVTSDGDKDFTTWFLTCCQPSSERIKPDHAPSKDTNVTHESKSPAQSDGDKFPSELPPSTPTHGASVIVDRPPLVTPPVGDKEPPLPSKQLHHIVPDENIPSPPVLKAPITSGEEHVIVSIPPPSQDGISEAGPTTSLIIPVVTPTHDHPRPGVSGIDIIKAIVYGGLLECITSLSVVSSAAGGDATTLNIVALGLANALGGLVLLLHNLRVLKHEHGTERYIHQLGSPGHFILHAVVAVLSYLVFGLIPPIIFGFAFRLSDNKDYKLATLAATSLVCIAILSIAKAYVRRPPKGYIQTIFYYIGVGFSVSGAGYAAGHLINELLKKLGVFDPSAPVAMSVFEAGAMKGAWSSY